MNASTCDDDAGRAGGERAEGEGSPFVPSGSLAARYLDFLLASDRAAATQLIDDALARGLSVRDLYLTVVQQTQYEVGRLWQLGRLSVAEEHFCTGVSQLVIARLYTSWLNAPSPNAPKAVVVCVDRELHELGARMVADFLEMDGWDTMYLGASAPPAAVAALLRRRRADLLGISSTMTMHGEAVARLIALVRDLPAAVQPRIVVGGYAFRRDEAAWRRLGADGCGRDAEDAVRVARALTAT